MTVTIAYIMHSMKVDLNEAFEVVKRKRANIAPNFNFMGQLQDFEKHLLSRRVCNCRCPKTTSASFNFVGTSMAGVASSTSSSATSLDTRVADVSASFGHSKLNAVSSLPLSVATPKSAPISSAKSLAVDGCACPCHNLKSYFAGASSTNSSSGSSAFSVTSSTDDTSSSSPQFSYDYGT